MIPQPFIDELIARADIVETVSTRVTLKKAGREFTACCPFHTEKTPSFTVSPQKQFYHCFGCGAHGTALGFLMDYEHLDFVEAVHDLARQCGLEVPKESGKSSARNELPAELVEQAARFYRERLKSHAPAIEYLKGRGIDGRTAAEFGLGYAPAGWDALLKRLGGDAGARKQLADAGLAIAKEGGRTYDRFRDRLMFPIRNARGRAIAFGGRVIGEGRPKYLNSPETAVFHKGHELYGLFEARQALRKIDRLLVVEGYMDVIALAQHDVRNAVATLGTATTAEHLKRLFRMTPEVVFCFDGDRAGRAAAWRALENALPAIREGRQIRFLFLPEGEDPDSLVRAEGAHAFTSRIKSARPLSNFLLERLKATADLDSVDGRARVVAAARPLLAPIPDPAYRRMLIGELAQLTRQSVENLDQALKTPASERAAPRPEPGTGVKTAMRQLIALLLKRPALAESVGNPAELAGIDVAGTRLLVELLEFIRARPHITTGGIVEHWRHRPEAGPVETLAASPLLVPEEGLEQEFLGRLAKLESRKGNARFDVLRAKPLAELSEAEKAELRALSGAATQRS
jgi:DNA primase